MLNFLYIAVSWVLLRWHEAFTWLGMDPASGLTWALSIVFLVITIRLLLFRFFIKQVHSQRKMQEVQPKIAALREKYKNDRQTLSQEMMKLQKEEGFNPIGGCLPILMQAPVFISLFHVLRLIGTDKAVALSGEYHWSTDQATLAGKATVFGAPIASAFSDPRNLVSTISGANATSTHVVAAVLVVLMVAATYITQRQVMLRSTATLDAQQAMIQKLMLYGIPASLLVSGFFFPIGVLFYWFTNNLWSMGQQFYILKRMPHPNAKADGVSPEVAKALAPKPGQKPVRPKRTAPAAIDAPVEDAPVEGAAAADAGEPAGESGGATASANGKSPNGKSPNGKAPAAKTPPAKAPGKAPNGKAPVNGTTPDAASDDTDAGADAGTGSAPGPRPKPGPGARPGGNGGRRPAGQRSPTQTRQKKKRR
ncbi:MAG TPA: membrane protein insertase YidC [Mycobacteriales bacterium]|nr:membrane protein insertase YidC [Mycobacteriales bacterium]